MKIRWFVLLFPFLVSCTPQATLFTDSIFVTAAPEILRAWLALGPWKDARVRSVPEGSDSRWWDDNLRSLPLGSAALVGVSLSQEERSALVLAHRPIHFVFFVPVREARGASTVTVDRAGAWGIVAQAAAPHADGEALFPPDATANEIRRVQDAWKVGGGGSLQTDVWPANPGVWDHKVLLQWAGPEADSLVVSRPSALAVHGDPGTARPPGLRGLTWALKESELGEFLWKVGQNRTTTVHFLTLETRNDTP